MGYFATIYYLGWTESENGGLPGSAFPGHAFISIADDSLGKMEYSDKMMSGSGEPYGGYNVSGEALVSGISGTHPPQNYHTVSWEITAQQFEQAHAKMQEALNISSEYALFTNNCVDHVEGILHAMGVNVEPTTSAGNLGDTVMSYLSDANIHYLENASMGSGAIPVSDNFSSLQVYDPDHSLQSTDHSAVQQSYDHSLDTMSTADNFNNQQHEQLYDPDATLQSVDHGENSIPDNHTESQNQNTYNPDYHTQNSDSTVDSHSTTNHTDSQNSLAYDPDAALQSIDHGENLTLTPDNNSQNQNTDNTDPNSQNNNSTAHSDSLTNHADSQNLQAYDPDANLQSVDHSSDAMHTSASNNYSESGNTYNPDNDLQSNDHSNDNISTSDGHDGSESYSAPE